MTRECRTAGCARHVAGRYRYCPACRRQRKRGRDRAWEKVRIRASATQRGYGSRHKTLRAVWARAVAAGNVRCSRCGKRIEPGAPWDLGHDDNDRSKYTGPEHQACNRATAGRRGQRRTSRAW